MTGVSPFSNRNAQESAVIGEPESLVAGDVAPSRAVTGKGNGHQVDPAATSRSWDSEI